MEFDKNGLSERLRIAELEQRHRTDLIRMAQLALLLITAVLVGLICI